MGASKCTKHLHCHGAGVAPSCTLTASYFYSYFLLFFSFIISFLLPHQHFPAPKFLRYAAPAPVSAPTPMHPCDSLLVSVHPTKALQKVFSKWISRIPHVHKLFICKPLFRCWSTFEFYLNKAPCFVFLYTDITGASSALNCIFSRIEGFSLARKSSRYLRSEKQTISNRNIIMELIMV